MKRARGDRVIIMKQNGSNDPIQITGTKDRIIRSIYTNENTKNEEEDSNE